jgi:cell shape-determining protein MreD
MFVAGAIMGYIMFSESIESQFTLNLPPNLMASKIAVWITVIVLFWTLDRKENYGL